MHDGIMPVCRSRVTSPLPDQELEHCQLPSLLPIFYVSRYLIMALIYVFKVANDFEHLCIYLVTYDIKQHY